MQYLNLEDIKKHLNVDEEFTSDDDYIQALGDVAEAIVEKHLDCDLANLMSTDKYGEIPAPVIHAMLLVIGNFYANRESIAFASSYDLPLSYQYILAPYKNYTNSKL